MPELPSGAQIVVGLIVGFVSFVVSWAVFIGIIWAIRNGLTGFLYHMEDSTTGFLKVRERVQAANREAAYLMENHTAVDVYGEHSLTLGATESSGYSQPLVIPGDYRTTHMYVIGASGAGKSSLLKNLILQDLNSKMGLCVIDPHGDLITDTIPHLGARKGATVILDLEDTEHMLGYNPLERKPGVLISEQVAKIMLAFNRVWGETGWGARMEDILRHTLALLIENGYTLAEFERVLADVDFRTMLLEQTDTDQTRDYFILRFNEWSSVERQKSIEAVLNKVSAFLADPRIGLRLGQTKSGFSIKEIMDTGGVLLVNIAKGRLGASADLFGALLMADIEMSFLTRAPGQREPFALYTDEFQNIATESFETVLTEARKFGLCLTMAHQSLEQLDDKLVALILGNAQTQVYFRVARRDAERLAKESANIVKQLQDKQDHLLQEPENKFTLQEMWEVAFHSLSRLEAREAFVMVKGAMEHPAKIRTLDNPVARLKAFDFGDVYSTIDALHAAIKERRAEIQTKIEAYLQRLNEERKKRKPSAAPPDAEPPPLDLPPEN